LTGRRDLAGDDVGASSTGQERRPSCADARFPRVAEAAPHYESFFLKACAPAGGLAVWLRATVLKPPGEAATGALWCSLFDAAADGPVAVRQTLPGRLAVPEGGYLQIGESRFTPGEVVGGAEAADRAATWRIGLDGDAAPLAHLPRGWLYRAPLPRTKLCSPQPAVRATGEVTVGGRTVELDGWPGTVGHNWGTQHAERWVWLHGTFPGEADETWLDVAVARVRVGRALTPWLASGALCLDGVRHQLGGPGRVRATNVAASLDGCDFELPGHHVRVRGTVHADRSDLVGWVYADPAGGSHDVANCSIATMELTVARRGAPPLALTCSGGAAYELGIKA
jgi:hypothetical protein